MNIVNFNNQKKHLVDELRAFQNEDPANTSYQYLLTQLSQLSLENLKSLKGKIIHFILDSYDGDTTMGDKIVQFLKLYSSSETKRT